MVAVVSIYRICSFVSGSFLIYPYVSAFMFFTFCLLFGLFSVFILGLTINQVAITCLRADVS